MSPFNNFLYIIFTIYIPSQADINCTQSAEACIINCDGANYCTETILRCKASQPCSINCIGDSACNKVTIIMNDATFLNMLCGSSNDDCSVLNAHCGSISSCAIKCNETQADSCSHINIIKDTQNTPIPIIHPNDHHISEQNDITPMALAITCCAVLLCACIAWSLALFMIRRHKRKYKQSITQNEKMSVEITANHSNSVEIDANDGTAQQKVRLSTNSFGNKASVVIVVEDDEDSASTSSSSTSSAAPPPPPPLTTSMIHNPNKYNQESATTIYVTQEQYAADPLMKSSRTVLTDASLYETQNAYLQQEMGLEHLAYLGADLFQKPASISETDVSLYQKQHEYLQEEVNEMEDERETPGVETLGRQSTQIETQSTLDVLYEDRRFSATTAITAVTTNTDASIFLKQQKYLQEELDEKHQTVGKEDETLGNDADQINEQQEEEEEKMLSPRSKMMRTQCIFD